MYLLQLNDVFCKLQSTESRVIGTRIVKVSQIKTTTRQYFLRPTYLLVFEMENVFKMECHLTRSLNIQFIF